MTSGRPFVRNEWVASHPFALDSFQLEALDAFDAHEHVVVAAPTGSGKTLVAEYAIAAVIATGGRAFYTTPIKALSNQKFRDLQQQHGVDRVGLLTGDNAVNAGAPIVVMTTEVLRNMIYTGSGQLDRLALVVLDEVHYLQDTYRGPVWEEVIIHVPEHVRLVCLSATVSNVDDLAEWISTVRGPTRSITEQRRPVRLENHYLVADRTEGRLRFLPVLVGGQPNRNAQKLDESAIRRGRYRGGGSGRGDDGARGRSATRGAGRRHLATPGRVETVELLDDKGLLPSIYFIFSRNACDEAAQACFDSGIVLTSQAEQVEIDLIVDRHLAGLAPDDLEVLRAERFRARLGAGIAAHHAGMVPPMKEAVEACFVAGLVKVVFATETLALGINMPARSVVVEKLTKFTGDHHEQLTPGEYTQLTGRAGRRGIDERGDAVVLWSPWSTFDDVATLVSSSKFPLRSAFRTTYNMAANLVRAYDHEHAHHLLDLSFGQFQADRDVVRLEKRLQRRRSRLAELREQAASPFGDIEDYRQHRDAARDAAKQRRLRQRDDVLEAVERLSPGAIVSGRFRGRRGPFVVVSIANRSAGLKVTMIDRDGDALSVTDGEFREPPMVVGSLQLPPGFAPQQRDYRNEVAYRLRRTKMPKSSGGQHRRRAAGDQAGADATGEESRSAVHPVEFDPDLKSRLRAAGQADRVAREVQDLERRASSRHHSLSKDFDRVLDVLDERGYVSASRWELTERGSMLVRVFHECDLLVCECAHAGLLDGLAAPDLAAIVSTFVYEHRSPEPPAPPWFSSAMARRRWQSVQAVSDELQRLERSAGLTTHRAPDPGFAAVAFAWVSGDGFAEVISDEDLTGGDFVRTTRQLIDLLRQLAQTAPTPATRAAAAEAAEAATRGVVADSTGAVS